MNLIKINMKKNKFKILKYFLILSKLIDYLFIQLIFFNHSKKR